MASERTDLTSGDRPHARGKTNQTLERSARRRVRWKQFTKAAVPTHEKMSASVACDVKPESALERIELSIGTSPLTNSLRAARHPPARNCAHQGRRPIPHSKR